MTKKSMIVAGVMSGTSADGINVALVRIAEERSSRSPAEAGVDSNPRGRGARGSIGSFELLGHAEYSYSKKVRAAVLAAMNAPQACVADVARLNFLLGELYADALLATQRKLQVKTALVGCHGQTLYHQGEAAPYLGAQAGCNLADGRGGDCGCAFGGAGGF